VGRDGVVDAGLVVDVTDDLVRPVLFVPLPDAPLAVVVREAGFPLGLWADRVPV
jgi:hypothetical protein